MGTGMIVTENPPVSLYLVQVFLPPRSPKVVAQGALARFEGVASWRDARAEGRQEIVGSVIEKTAEDVSLLSSPSCSAENEARGGAVTVESGACPPRLDSAVVLRWIGMYKCADGQGDGCRARFKDRAPTSNPCSRSGVVKRKDVEVGHGQDEGRNEPLEAAASRITGPS